ncbi:MAG TPA: LLM class F420-dependent oxidoreductase, partial [Amycolatopsis sp.]|nr:LLM class F420-dependent oxidoreductase [Amycolatopsis sp.]
RDAADVPAQLAPVRGTGVPVTVTSARRDERLCDAYAEAGVARVTFGLRDGSEAEMVRWLDGVAGWVERYG